jgi:methionyl-tRNA formyltransferase
MPLRLAFFGTPAFAVPTLSALLGSPHQVVAVVTQPDRPRGRGQRLVPSPVKQVATERQIAVLQPERIRDHAFLAQMEALSLDLGIVAAYGKILPQQLLDAPRQGMLNVHASLLPRWRGAAPVHRAILAGDIVTGVTIMRVVQALDAGPMLAREAVGIGPDETSAELEPRLAELGARLLLDTLAALAAGRVREEPQDEALVTYAARLERRESRIEWAQPAGVVHNAIRGLQPWPLAAAQLHGRRLALLGSRVESSVGHPGDPGVIVRADADGLIVATHPGSVRIERVQLEGRPAMSVRVFLNGHRVCDGDQLLPLPIET